MASVLIIDDNEKFCSAIAVVLSHMGHSLEEAYTLKTGVQKAISKAYDLVLLDVQLPDGNGLDVLPVIRQAPSSPEVIVITGVAHPDGAEVALGLALPRDVSIHF